MAAIKPMAEPEKDTLIGSGSFRVDRGRALEKIQKFQLPDPNEFLLCWARFALLSGASELRLKTLGRGVELRFEGRPLGRREHEDPYGALLEDDAEPRRKFLAYGLLAALRLGPHALKVASGAGAARRLLLIKDLARQEFLPPEDEGTAVVLSAEWFWSSERHFIWRQALNGEPFALSPVPVFLDGAAIDARGPGPEGALHFKEGLLRGWIMAPNFLKPPESSVRAYAHGVRVAPLNFNLPTAKVSGMVNHDRFALNASLSGVARDAVYARVERLLDLQAARLLLKTAESHEKGFAETGRLLLDAGLLSHWRKRFHWGPGFTFDGSDSLGILTSALAYARGGQRRVDAVKRVYRDAHLTIWLRDAAARLLPADPSQAKTRLEKALWRVPLFFSVSGRPMNLLELEAHRREHGFIAPSASRVKAETGSQKVWCATTHDLAWLKRRFPGAF